MLISNKVNSPNQELMLRFIEIFKKAGYYHHDQPSFRFRVFEVWTQSDMEWG